jgi:beta-glucosidase
MHGQGLGYTDWSYESVLIRFRDFAAAADGGDPYVTVAEAVLRLRNTGQRAGREVVQIYLAADADAEAGAGESGRAPRQPAGSAAVEADAGEAAEARVELPLRVFQRWAEGEWRLRTGLHVLEAAHGSGGVRAKVSLEIPARR